jgi:putative permease
MSPAVAAVILVFVLVLIAGTIWLLRLPLQLFIIAALVAVGISHPVNWLEQRRVPRIVAVIAMLAVTIAGVVVLIIIFLPPLTREVHDLIDRIPGYWTDLRARLTQLTRAYPQIQERIAHLDISGEAAKRLEGFVGAGWSFAVGVAGGLFTTILVVITIVFMLANPQPLVRGILGAVPEPWSARASQIAGLIEDRMRAWLRGLVILGSIIGVMVGIGLWALHVPYAVLFGIIAGLLEMIPTVGPVLAAIPPILVALAIEPVKALYVGILFIAVQQIENTFLVPYVMRRQLQLHPVSTIFGFIAMGKLFGLFGAIIAVPTVACLKVLYDEIYYPWAHPGAGTRLEPKSVPLLPTAAGPEPVTEGEAAPPET